MNKKAYQVMEEDYGTGGIVFATTKRQAIKIGASMFGDGDPDYYDAIRQPSFDCYAETGKVPVIDMVELGWRFECHGCCTTIAMANDDDDDYVGPHWSSAIGTQHTAFCCHQCAMEYWSDKAAREAYVKQFLAMMEDWLKSRLDSRIEICQEETMFQRDGVTAWNYNPIVIRHATLAFKFPGSKHGWSHLRYRHENTYGGGDFIGPVFLNYYVPNGDREAFMKYVTEVQDAKNQN